MIRRLGLTEGQAYTAVIALAFAIVLGVAGIPSVLGTRTLPAAAEGTLVPRRDAAAVASAPTTTPQSPPPAPAPAVALRRPPRPAGPTGGVAAAPSLPPTIDATPGVSPPSPLTITTFALVDHPGAPGGLAVTVDGRVYVSTDNGTLRGDTGASRVFAFDATGTKTGERAISGQPDDHAHGLTAVAIDPLTGELAVLEPDAARVIGLDASTGAQRTIAELPDLPACLVSLGASPCQQGADDRPPFPAALAFDRAGSLFITDPAEDTIWRLRRGDRVPAVWYQSPYFNAGDGPYGLALDDDAVEFTVGTTLDPAAPASGGLYRVAVDDEGAAGALTLVAPFARGEAPGALALGNSGTAYVALRGASALVAIAPAGTQSWRIDAPGTGSIPLDSPSGLAITAGQLLVTNAGSGTDPAHWAVLAVSVNDGTRP